MQRMIRFLIVALSLITLPVLAACHESETPPKEDPARVEEIPGSEYKRVIITEKAARRLGLQTIPVREEQVTRKQAVGGEVVTLPETQGAEAGPLWARVSLHQSEWSQVDLGQPGLVLPLDADDEGEPGWFAEPDEGPPHDDTEDVDLPGEDLVEELYYQIAGPGEGLAVGQAVLVELALSAEEPLRKVVPYAAVLYGVNGETWVYTNPEPLSFVREAITVDYVEKDKAFLLEGPEVGTAVVTLGAAELFGTETGVSK